MTSFSGISMFCRFVNAQRYFSSNLLFIRCSCLRRGDFRYTTIVFKRFLDKGSSCLRRGDFRYTTKLTGIHMCVYVYMHMCVCIYTCIHAYVYRFVSYTYMFRLFCPFDILLRFIQNLLNILLNIPQTCSKSLRNNVSSMSQNLSQNPPKKLSEHFPKHVPQNYNGHVQVSTA